MLNINQEAIKLINNLNGGYMRGLAYDTAWAAMIPESQTSLKPMFPGSLLWLIINQHENGSWGGNLDYSYDRLISTLASIISLKKTHRSEKFKEAISNGEEYIWFNIQRLRKEPQETVGFELLFPALMAEAENLELNLPYRERFFEPLKEKKMKLIIGELIASQNTTVTFSLEFLGEFASKKLLTRAQNINGSISNSPSATAFMLTKQFNDDAYNYLRNVLKYNSGSSMTLYPFDVFESAWVIDNFYKTKLPVQNHYTQKIEELFSLWTEQGVSMSKYYDFQDLDDTATVFYLLKNTNHDIDPSVFEVYEDVTHFNTYPSERSSSPLVNIRVLKALNNNKKYNRRDEVVEKILKYLYKEMKEQSYWIDKWNISPYYCTSQAIEAISELDTGLTEKAVNWLIDTQKIDGSWGISNGTQEETSYALLALLYYHFNVEKIDSSILKTAQSYLENNYNNDFYEELWLGKGLYCPQNVVKSSILSAIHMSKGVKAKK
jgi:hypothetical protein